MRKIMQFKNMTDVMEYMDTKVFDYINEGQIESFESFDDFDLLAFDYYDIRSVKGDNSKIMIYLDGEDLFFFCEDEISEKRVISIVNELTEKEEPENDKLLYYFFVQLLKGDMDYLDSMEQKINDEEPSIFADSEREALERISNYRKKLLKLKRYYEQLDSIFDEMAANDNELLPNKIVKRIVILGARTDRYLSTVRSLQETVNQMREAYQSQLSIKQNELMKFFTIVTAIFLPLTLIAGWYGMNFAGMPEFKWKYGYPTVIAVSIITVILLIWYFRKKKWL